MGATATITAIRTTQCGEFIAHKMLVTSATMSTAAKYADLVYKITFLQNCTFNVNPAFVSFLLPSVGSCKYTLTNYNSSFMKYLLILLVFPFLSASECGKKKEKGNVTEGDRNATSGNDSIPVVAVDIPVYQRTLYILSGIIGGIDLIYSEPQFLFSAYL